MTIPKQQFPMQQIIPSLANSQSRTPGDQAYSVWSQIIASTSWDFVLCGAYFGVAFQTLASPPAVNSFARVVGDIGKGAAGSEVVIGQFADQFWVNKGGTTDQALLGTIRTHFFTPTFVASGSRLAIRVWSNKAATPPTIGTNVYLFGYKASEWGQVRETLQDRRFLQGLVGTDTKVLPAAAGAGGGANVVAAAGAWTYGTPVEVVAASAITKPSLIRGVCTGVDTAPGGTNRAAQMQIVVGGVVQDIVGIPSSFSGVGQPGGGNILLYRPIWVPPNAQVQLQAASAVTEGYDSFLITEVLR